MVEPLVIPRAEHTISRGAIDPDALRVLYRLRHAGHAAYLVGGGVRDLLLGRRPKDFDIGTSAHPYEIKRLFRNCWIIGRRFRLAHVRFGPKTIEVATFRKKIPDAEPASPPDATTEEPVVTRQPGEHLLHRDNTFGTPEEDAFRRDFTVNALFYDIATFSIIDYVGGLADLRARNIRCIGDPDERFREDPVRMLRAVALAARLDFTIDPPILEAIGRHRQEIARAAPARLIEEYYKILRAGAAERAFRALAEHRLLEPTSPELQAGATDDLWEALAAIDRYRARFQTTPDSLGNAILLGTLIVPLGLARDARRARRRRRRGEPGGPPRDATERPPVDAPADPRATLGMLPLARRDLDRLRHLLALQPRLLDPTISPRARRALMHRSVFPEALTWLEIHGRSPDVVDEWRAYMKQQPGGPPGGVREEGHRVSRRRRRRRRRRFPRPVQEG